MEKIKLTENKQDKKQPSNLEAEQALLGSILVNNDIIDEIANIINPTSFYDPAHTKIYEVIETLNNKGMIANPITLKNFFEKDNMLEEVGGTEYLVKLTRFSIKKKQNIFKKQCHVKSEYSIHSSYVLLYSYEALRMLMNSFKVDGLTRVLTRQL